MIKLTQVPPGLATGATYLVEVDEHLCRPYCVNSTIQPSATVTFSDAAPTVNDGIAVIPVTAKVTITSPSASGCGCAHTQLFTELVNIPLTATTDNNVTLTASSEVSLAPISVQYCKVRDVRVTTILEVAIA